MSKGSGRRPEDRAAIEQNWEQAFGLPKKRKRAKIVETGSRPICVSCYRIINRCKHCKRAHCPCIKLADCRYKAPKRVGDPLEQSPYGFNVDRSGCRDIGAPAEKDTAPMLNIAEMKKRGRL